MRGLHHRAMPSIGDIANDIARTLYEFRIPVALASIGLAVLAVVVAHRLGWIAAARRHRLRTVVLLLAALAVMVPVGWYLGSPIFIRTSLVEAVPAAPTVSVVPTIAPAPSLVPS